MKRLILSTLVIGLLAQSLQSQAQVHDRTLRFGDVTAASHVAATGNDRWLVAGTTWAKYDAWYAIDSIFVATLNDAGEVLSIFFPALPPSETHFVNQLLPLPNGDLLLAFESTLCDVLYDISTVRRYNAAGEVVWEIMTDFQTWNSPPRSWHIAPDGNLIGLIDNELWKINAETGATIWETILFDYQSSSDPMPYKITLVPGTENLLGIGSPTLSFWTQHVAGGGAVAYTPDSTLSLPDIYIQDLVARADGWIYLMDKYKGDLLRTRTDLQPEYLTTQPGNIVDFKLASDGLYFLKRLETGTRFYKTDFDGNAAQDLGTIAFLLIPSEMSIGSDKAIIGGSDGSGPNSSTGTVNYYPWKDVEHAWARIAPLAAAPNTQTADAGITEALTLVQPTIETMPIDFEPYTVYNVSGGNFKLKITNHGNSTLEKVWVNQHFEDASLFNICPVPDINTKLFEGLNLSPGESTWVEFSDIRSDYRISVPSQICFWTSGPNDEPDFDKSNDHACAEIVSSVPVVYPIVLNIYPNPVDGGFINVQLAELPNATQWRLTDMLGRMVRTGHLTQRTIDFQIEVGDLASGFYCFKIGGWATKIVID
jgi:Secretion system C-terminal sorting domain